MSLKKIILFLLISFTCIVNSHCITYAISSPTEKTGLVLWLDGKDPNDTGTAPSNGTSITTWKDKSDSNLHAVRTSSSFVVTYITSTENTDYLEGSLHFNNVNSPSDSLKSSLDMNYADMTIFTLLKQNTTSSTSSISSAWGQDNGGYDRTFYAKLGSTTKFGLGNYDGGTVSVPDLYNTNWNIATIRYDTGSISTGSHVFVNGPSNKTFTARTERGKNTTAIGNSGNGHPYKGYLAEVIMYSRALSDEEITDVHYYLSTKWGLESSIDSDGDGILDNLDPLPTSNITEGSYDHDQDGVPDGQDSYPLDNNKVVDLPLELSEVSENLVLWLDASSDTAMQSSLEAIPVDGDAISSWYDWSGKKNHITQSTALNMPVFNTAVKNGLPVLSFDDTQYLDPIPALTQGNSSRTILAVINPSTDSDLLLSYGGNFHIYASNNTLSVSDDTNTYGKNHAIDRFSIITLLYDASTSKLTWYKNRAVLNSTPLLGSKPTTFNTGTSTGSLGSLTNGFRGDLCEILILDKAISKTERRDLERYLSKKWGIPLQTGSSFWFGR